MDYLTALITLFVVALLGFSVGFFALYQKSKENKAKQH